MSVERDDEFRAALQGLRQEQMPERDLWPGIEARIGAHAGVSGRRARTWRWIGYAAAAGIVGAVSLGVWQAQPPAGAPGAGLEPSVSAGANAYGETTPGIVVPQERALLKAHLSIVKDAERQLRDALDQDPESESLRRLLDSMQQRRGALKGRLQET